ncbi:ferrous iron transporter B [Aestuariirhabdus litorea]|uniref:Ferrous iron transporter B n=1 Tax=Aestuariirhabdus litorea TaxID=2528527 RepID=A0A3P3VT78_9GAMM|nr:ferrous iron transporter B [Aestuariirhabdus litorea]RRJ84886.1 ferrous iron transporter B [Aestuariirhabdus litorea]RWW98113.1 ferrous iron transporter B [Endozoicomonadaceae bacterium GTF-13]
MAGASSLNLVREELESTIQQAENSLEQFIEERDQGAHLQACVDCIKQVRGTLSLIEMSAGELLAEEMFELATDIPEGAGNDRDDALGVLSNSLFVLSRYLEYLQQSREEIPELLLPTVNELRRTRRAPLLPESFFYSIRAPLPEGGEIGDLVASEETGRRLRLMYQVGLLGLFKEENTQSSLKLMERALQRLYSLMEPGKGARLLQVASAALEVMVDAEMGTYTERKLLFGKVDRLIRMLVMGDTAASFDKTLVKELLYLVVLGDTQGELAREVKKEFNLLPLPFNDHTLAEERSIMAGPGNEVFRSLSAALKEELSSLKDMLDLVERGSNVDFEEMSALVGRLPKTLGMVGLVSASKALQANQEAVASWGAAGKVEDRQQLMALADAILYVESMVASLEQPRAGKDLKAVETDQATIMANNQLFEARIVVIDETQAGLAMLKRAITAFTESDWDQMHLANVDVTLDGLRGGLFFIDEERASNAVAACQRYLKEKVLGKPGAPSQGDLETLADALTGLDFYLQGLNGGKYEGDDVLKLAESAVKELGFPV